jgi:hypothetical protein
MNFGGLDSSVHTAELIPEFITPELLAVLAILPTYLQQFRKPHISFLFQQVIRGMRALIDIGVLPLQP